jgi:hypothetical protein
MPHLSWNEVRDRAIRFARTWSGATSERADKQTFWNEFFEVFGIRRASVASFEANVRNLQGHINAIDLLWRGKLLVEHKSRGEDLGLAETQAFGYIEDLAREGRQDEIPRFVLVSDFANFVLYDLEPEEQRDLPLFEGRRIAPHHFTLAEFSRHIRAFAFMLGQTRVRLDPEDPANEKAYRRMCELHDELKAGGFTGHELERLLVRILFCMFAEDNGIFPPDAFTQFIRTRTHEDGSDLAQQLNYLFYILDTDVSQRPQELDDEIAAFPYVNGQLFRERLGYPPFNRAMRASLLFCCDFEWSRISPAVFGSLFQGVMEDSARRQQGAHYTSERDIMKVLRSLFLDELQGQWTRLCADRSTRRRAGMEAFHQQLRSLQFLDPACGCGNFLVLTYRELRALEIEVVRELSAGVGAQQLLPIVNVDQFHGIEYSEWPVRIAEVALWLMDHQMNRQASEVFGQPIDRLPLRSSPHIVQNNALRLDWNEVLPREQCSYVLGNPPFVGKQFRTPEQQSDLALIWDGVKGSGVLDYVTCWYVKAARYIDSSHISVAFVSTNSITQGEQVGILWGELFQRYHLKIHFAHRTFAWTSEARGSAHVHVVIIGFGAFDRPGKRIFDYETSTSEPTETSAANINPYLIAGADLCVFKRRKPLAAVEPMVYGSKPVDGGHLLMDDRERSELLHEAPEAARFIRPFTGSVEFINGINRWCLWLPDTDPASWRRITPILRRVEAVRDFRRVSDKPVTVEQAATPYMFGELRQPASNYLVVPENSSINRSYIPIGFVTADVIASNLIYTVPGASILTFGILNSVMHMAWVRYVTGRLKSDYRYSAGLVYNNFPWPTPTPEQRNRVEEKARAVLAAREPHLPPSGMSTLADLYDPLTMPAPLAHAHAELDRAVEKCYRAEQFRSDRERVEHLFRLYEQLTAPLLPATPRRRGRARGPAADGQTRPRRGRTPGLSNQSPQGNSTV